MGDIRDVAAFQRSIQPAMLQPLLPGKTTEIKETSKAGSEFAKILNGKLEEVKFSQHALNRLKERNISLGDAEKEKLQDAVTKAGEKGSKEALVLLNENLALVVSVKNRTVITAMDRQDIKNNVFTNIDSAVILWAGPDMEALDCGMTEAIVYTALYEM